MDIGIVRILGLMTGHRGSLVDNRSLSRLDRSVVEARELCDRAHELFPDDPDGAIANAFQTTLAQTVQEWLQRAEAAVSSVRTGRATICGARADELRVLIDAANVAMMRQPTGRQAWRNFHRAVLALEPPAQNNGG